MVPVQAPLPLKTDIDALVVGVRYGSMNVDFGRSELRPLCPR